MHPQPEPAFVPAYVETAAKGLLKEKIRVAAGLLSPCRLCPRQCNIDRTKGASGICQTGRLSDGL